MDAEFVEDTRPNKRQRLEDVKDALKDSFSNSTQNTSSQDDQVQKEVSCGIKAFILPDVPRFSGVLKQRYTDFLVNEILPDGTVLHLKSLRFPRQHAEDDERPTAQSAPSNADAQPAPQTSNTSNTDPSSDPSTVSEADVATLTSLVGAETTTAITQLYKSVLAQPSKKPTAFQTHQTPQVSSRETRTEIHQSIRRIFTSRLDTLTRDDSTIAITVARKRPAPVVGSSNPISSRGKKPSWQAHGGDYLHFTLHKTNKDTMEILSYLGSQMHVPPKRFNFAGTKDRRAVTVQRCCCYRVSAQQLHGVGKKLRGGVVGDFEYKGSGLTLGDLGGNRFTISLKDARPAGDEALSFEERKARIEAVVAEVVPALEERGFLNYYGLQRFGSFAVPTHAVGMRMLQGDLKSACDAILSFSANALEEDGEAMVSSDDRARAKGIKTYCEAVSAEPPEFARAYEAASQIPRKSHAEANIMKHLSGKNGNRRSDYQGALMNLPRNLRLMYVHAYQSFVFNSMVSERWRRWGEEVVAGDLVLIEKGSAANGGSEGSRVDQDGEAVIDPAEEDKELSKEEEYQRARPLSEEEARSGKWNISDVVLPLPGFDVNYPDNEIGEEYKTFMASEEGGKLDPHNMKRSWKDVSMAGGYRRIIGRVLGTVEWEVKRYARNDEDLIETEAEVLIKKEKSSKRGSKDMEVGETDMTMVDGGDNNDAVHSAERLQDPEGDKLAVILKLSLGPSTYATMALRELMGAGGCREYKGKIEGRK